MPVEIIRPLYFILPIFFTNMAAHRFGGGTPVDFGRYFYDGKRIFGDGKTYSGLVGGIVIGTLVSMLQPCIYPTLYNDLASSFIFGLIISSGAVFGDTVKSFFKRRLGIERGNPFPIVDQSDFVWGALLFYYLLGPLLLPDFFALPVEWLAVILIVSPFIHFVGNILAYRLKLKEVWW